MATIKNTITANVGKNVKKKEPSYTAGGNVNLYNYYGKHYGNFSKKLKIDLPFDPATPLLEIYPKKCKVG
jgi:hypothetical protein